MRQITTATSISRQIQLEIAETIMVLLESMAGAIVKLVTMSEGVAVYTLYIIGK